MPNLREPFLPNIQKDELIYSLIARFCEARHIGPSNFNKRYLETRKVSIAFDIPLRILQLTSLMPDVEPETLLANHTLLPFLTATTDPAKRSEMIKKLVTGKASHFRISLPQGTPRAKFLRFCIDCDADDRERFGFAYWNRRHQLPTSLVCAKHGAPLRLSPVSTGTGRKIRYFTAGQWGGERPTLAPIWADGRLDRCIRLAELGYKMLDMAFAEPRVKGALRQMAVVAGYQQDRSRLSTSRLKADLEKYDAFLHMVWPDLGPRMSMPFSWIAPHLSPSICPDRKPAFTWAILKTFFETDLKAMDAGRDDALLDNVASEQLGKHIDSRLPDDVLVSKIHVAANEIRGRVPEERVTRAEIFRQVPIIRRRASHPAVADALSKNEETIEQFEYRRIRRGIKQLAADGLSLTASGLRMITKSNRYDIMQEEVAAFRSV